MIHSLEERAFIIQNYNPENPNAAEAVRKFNEQFGYFPCNKYVNQLWKSEGFKIGKRGGRRHGLSEEEARRYHSKYNGNPSAASEESGYKSGSIRKRWTLLGLD